MGFKKLNILSYVVNIISIFNTKEYKGWGRKKTGRFAVWCQKNFSGRVILYEDGFIRSIGLGIDGSKSYSIVEDNIGIYYDATVPSKLENLLSTYDFKSDVKLMKDSKKAIDLILRYNISKYNDGKNFAHVSLSKNKEQILIILQTEGDASLKYGMLENYTTTQMIDSAIDENPNADIYLKIHPDVLSGKKRSDIDIANVKKQCFIIEENVNPISLLKNFSKVYTKTSQMGFEALLVGCECVCFGMPFYAGWGATIDKQNCSRRKRNLSVEEIFSASYILYTNYRNPYNKDRIDIFETINTIVQKKSKVLDDVI